LYLKRFSDGAKEVEINGNVGIGTTSPTAKLDVEYNQGTLSSYNYSTTSTWHGKGLRLAGGSNHGGFLYGHDINHSIFLRQSPFGTADHNAYCNVGYHAFYTGGHIQNQTERLRITSDGKVGIGRTDPDYTLDVDGHTRVGNQLYIGKNTGDETAKGIFFGGTYADNDYNHAVIETRIYSTGTEKKELLIYCGNDGMTSAGPDRIRLKASEILFDYLSANTDRTSGNTRMKLADDGNLLKYKQASCRVGMSGANFTLAASSTNVIVYNYEQFDINNDYNTSTGKFTCPHAGRYLVFHVLTGRDSNTTQGIVEAKIFWNNSEVNRQFMGYGDGNYNATASCIVNAAANDTLNAGIWNGNANNVFNGHNEGGGSQFIVYFLG
jgi:hypothetical protein